MRTLVAFLLAFTLSPLASAGELDSEHTVAPEQVRLSKDLPQTLIIRVDKKNPKKIVVLHSMKKIAAGTKIGDKKFEQLAMNAEVSNLPYNPKTELDTNSSTSSWFFGLGFFGNAACWNGCGYDAYYPYHNTGYYPYYRYASYTYPYYPYWGYSTDYYDYSYCGWDPYYY